MVNVENTETKAVADNRPSISFVAPSKRVIMASIAVLVAVLLLPSVVCMFELIALSRQQALLTQALQGQVQTDVASYMSTTEKEMRMRVAREELLAEPYVDNFSAGTLSNPSNEIPYEAISKAVSEILTQDYINNISDDMLVDLYARIDEVVTEKMSDVTISVPTPAETSTQTDTPSVNYVGNTSNTNVTTTVAFSDADIQKVVDATMAIVMVDLTSYKQEMLLKYEQLDNMVKTLDQRYSVSGTSYSSLTNDVNTLSSTYDSKFSQLESADSNLQSQISTLKAQNANISSQYNNLQTSIQLANSNMESIKVLLQSRIDTLQNSSNSKDNELANTLSKAQTELNTTIATEDRKIYDNAVRIIQLTDKMTAMDSSMTNAIDALNKQTGEDTRELYNALLILQADLEDTDTNLSTAVNQEMAERRESVKEILAMIRQLQETAITDSDDLTVLMEQKTRRLAAELAGTNEDMQAEYMALISKTNTDLKTYVDAQNAALTQQLNEKSTALDNKIDSTATTLDNKIGQTDAKVDSTAATLDSKIDTTSSTLDTKITTTANSLDSKIDSTDAKVDSTAATLDSKIDSTASTLDSKIDTTSSNLDTKIDESSSALDTKINDSASQIYRKITDTDTTLNSKIDTTAATLQSQIDTTNLQTQEQMAQAIASLQAEIEMLQLQVQQLQDEKLNTIDSTSYEYRSSDNTIKITVPDSNPNFVK